MGGESVNVTIYTREKISVQAAVRVQARDVIAGLAIHAAERAPDQHSPVQLQSQSIWWRVNPCHEVGIQSAIAIEPGDVGARRPVDAVKPSGDHNL